MRLKRFAAISLVILLLVLPSCKTNSFTLPTPVAEISPGLLQGYLSKKEMPNSLTLLPPPPEEGSTAFALDQEYAKHAAELIGEARYVQATNDADLIFPEAVNAFDPVLGLDITEAQTPKLYLLLRRILTDAAMSTYAAKQHYNRKRPFMVNNSKTCTPELEDALRKDGSYPSGHSAIGWAWTLVFCEIFPSKADAILQRGYAFGESRVICNVHWQSDVDMGRVIGSATVSILHSNLGFQNDLEAAKIEVKKALLSP
jgi:acid phosphatase (class A)